MAYLITRVAEVCIHRANYRILRKAGAEELIPRLMRRYYLQSLLIIPAAILESYCWDQPSSLALRLGLVALAGGVLLRIWAIASLGLQWSMRCLALATLRARAVGPYRFLDNPEYLSRLIDGVGLCVVLGAKVVPLIFVVIQLLLQRRITSIEGRQLIEISHAKPDFLEPQLDCQPH